MLHTQVMKLISIITHTFHMHTFTRSFQTHTFSRSFHSDKRTNAYAAHLREKANNCEFEANCDERILEHLIQTTQNRSLIQKAINKK